MPSTPTLAAASYSARLHTAIGEHYIDVVHETHPEIAAVLRFKAQQCSAASGAGLDEPVVDPAFHQSLGNAVFEKLGGDPERVALCAEMDAKLVDVQRRARKYAGIAVTSAVAHTSKVRMGDTFDEVVERFCRANLSPAVVRELLEYAHVWPSFTTHPTNPMSFQYTAVGARLDAALSAGTATTTEALKQLLRQIRDTSFEHDADPKGGDGNKRLLKKTPELEIQELCLFLDVSYDSVVGPHRRLRSALDRFGYADVPLDGSMANICVWGAGDGDGNPNMDDRWLLRQIEVLSSRVRARYIADLNAAPGLNALAQKHQNTIGVPLRDLVKALGSLQPGSESALTVRLERLVKAVHGCAGDAYPRDPQVEAALVELEDIAVKVKAFGLRFARTDVRHNSVDIMSAVTAMLTGFSALPSGTTPDQFENHWTSERQSALLRTLLSPSSPDAARLAQAVAASSNDDIQERLGKHSAAAARVFLRMRVIAQHPSAFEKLIIAETRTAANGLAALLLLKLAGNVIAAPGACISVVPLFESRADLADAPRTFHTLASDPVFQAHLSEVGYFIAMIAKSDTTRLSGAGVLGRQEMTVAQLMAMNHASYGGRFRMHIFVGGGDDQMRGGGRIVETPHVLSIAARRLEAKEPSRFALTIQGMQMQITFGARTEAEYFIEALAAQQCLAAARVKRVLKYRLPPAVVNKSAANMAVHEFFEATMDNYEFLIGLPKQRGATAAQASRRQAMVSYLTGFPTSIVASGNKSSRPMARTKNVDPLEGRAISLDQLSKHDGAYVTATLGVAAALRRLAGSMLYGSPEDADVASAVPLSPLRHAYLGQKTFRDFVRMQCVVLAQKDHAVAWRIRGGPPATAEERAALVDEYKRKAGLAEGGDKSAGEGAPPSARALLAYSEAEDHDEARMLVLAITGRAAPDGPIKLDTPLKAGWPELARAMALRARNSALAQSFETRAALAIIDAKKNSGDDAAAQRLGYLAYVGANPQFSTPNFSMTMTDPAKEAVAARVVASAEVAQRLRFAPWAVSAGQAGPRSKI